ncbi:hypothetical protein [Blautia sp. An81]|uniref:hypothetical protein n=1 Tax=Blautia sp. An81 TaxID=1965659 RepID=UPI000B38F437|nr:hypothetical protein [Blautia sp. An81]OUN23008.1 hypothetical protein B5G33_20280 [Blautia sp. An81]
MEELKKEIESLKRKTFYLSLALLVISVAYASSVFLKCRRYATIQDYYFESLESDRELNQNLWEQNQILEEILSKTQSDRI